LIPLSIVIDLDPNLFKLGPFLISWHGVFAVLGILAGARLGLWLLSKDRVDVTHGADGVAWMVVVGLIGARLLYVWENYKLFAGQLGRIFLLTEGGISQWGGLFGAMVGAYIWARRAAINYWKIIDAAGAATMIGLAIGRIGDVINGEHHGTPTNLPWGVEYVNPNTLGQPGLVVHPEVAYEMVLTLVLLGALLPFHQRLKARLPDGVTGLIYLGLYGLGRFFLSYLRTDPAVFAGLRQAQLASLLMFVIAVVAIPILIRRQTTAVRRELVHEPEVASKAQPHELEPESVAEPEPVAEIAAEPVTATSPDPVSETPISPPPRKPRAPGAPRRPRTTAPPPAEPTDDLPG
jgi:phosphatidylglycerol:prolipoprotein diacylglycerol transferase